LLQTASGAYRSQVSNYCGNCHPDLTGRYAMSTHGKLTELGYVAAAKCPDCHGAHEILPIDDPQGMLALGDNRLTTCRKCHAHAVMNFSRFDPHADHKDAARYPTLYRVYSFVHTVFYAFMAFFVIHAFLWFVRSFVTVLRYGRHRTLVAGRYVIERSTVLDRTIYVMLLGSVLGLLATGLPLKYSSQNWAYVYVQALGGFEYTSLLHHVCATVALVCCAAHAICVVRYIGKRRRQGKSWIAIAVGPDSPAPTPRDARDMFGMLRWFFGLGPKPTFERWTYWEKYDYWMACVACLLVGTSGLILWFPNIFCWFISGQTLNLVRVIHVELSVLAASFLLVFHFYHTHFRPEKFPLDLSAVTGLVNEGHLREQRPAYVARLEEMQLLSDMRRPAPTRGRLWQLYVGTFVVLLIGLGLLAVALTAALGK
jgi:cytochrome b subunit of formate dehydrogenase